MIGVDALIRQLPVYRLRSEDWVASAPAPGPQLELTLSALLRSSEFDGRSLPDGRWEYSAGSRVVVLDPRTGWLCFEDTRHLSEQLQAKVPTAQSSDESSAFQLLHSVFDASPGLRLPKDVSTEIANLGCSGSVLATYDTKTRTRTQTQISRSCHFSAEILVEAAGTTVPIPVAGDVGMLGIAVAGDSLISLHRGWQTLEEELTVRVLERTAVDRWVLDQTPGLIIVRSVLIYDVMESGPDRFLVPMRLYEVVSDGHGPNRLITAPATDWRPAPRTTPTVSVRLASPGSYAAGAMWIEQLGKIKQTQSSAKGFLANLPAEWGLRFSLGDHDVTYDRWFGASADAESVDLLFYAGHADDEGWQRARSGGSHWVSREELEREQLGRGQLKWLVLAACGPHWDHVSRGDNSDAMDRWHLTFGGLRSKLGYGSIIRTEKEEGPELATAAQVTGATLISAWMNTARHCQNQPLSGPIWASSMWASGSDDSATDNPIQFGDGALTHAERRPKTLKALWCPIRP